LCISRVCEKNQLDSRTFGHCRAEIDCTYSLPGKICRHRLNDRAIRTTLAAIVWLVLCGRSSISIAIDQFEHRVLSNVQRRVIITHREGGLLESPALRVLEKITQFRFSGRLLPLHAGEPGGFCRWDARPRQVRDWSISCSRQDYCSRGAVASAVDDGEMRRILFDETDPMA
jgi:hypothetical protein